MRITQVCSDPRLYYTTPLTINLLQQSFTSYNWSGTIVARDNKSETLPVIYCDFVRIAKWHVNCCIPVREVSMPEWDPAYITPRIKLDLQKRNKLRRTRKFEKADRIAVKINKQIACNRSTALSDMSNVDSKHLQAMFMQTGNWGLVNMPEY